MPSSETRPYRYDELVYPSRAVWYSHPRHLATRAHLLGLSPPDVQTCRVLELGAGTGGNLIPMASKLPEARFTGYDLSRRQVAQGNELAALLGLSNVDLHQADLRDLPGKLGEFDYIICHGVYSWVAPDVQHAILAIIRQHLAPDGLACVSYNVLPGWSVRLALHHLLSLHDDESLEANTRIERAVQELRDLKVHVERKKDALSQDVATELKTFDRMDQSYFFHEFLESINEPLYFKTFAEGLPEHELRYLGNLVTSNAPFAHWPEGDPGLDDEDVLREESVRDVRAWCRFRSTLIGGAHLNPVRTVSPERLYPLSMAMRIDERRMTYDAVFDGPITLVGPDEKPVVLRHGMEVVARALLAAYPAAMSFDELFALLPEQHAGPAWTRRRLAERLLPLYFTGALRLNVYPERVTNELSEKPHASRLSRLEAQEDEWVTNAWHMRVQLTTVQRVVLMFLNGERTLDQVREEFVTRLESGELKLTSPGSSTEKLVSILPNLVEELAKMGLLDS